MGADPKQRENGRSLLGASVIICSVAAMVAWLYFPQLVIFWSERSLLEALHDAINGDRDAFWIFVVHSPPIALGAVCLVLGARGLRRCRARISLIVCSVVGAAASAFLHSMFYLSMLWDVREGEMGWFNAWAEHAKLGPSLTILAFLLITALIIGPSLLTHPWDSSFADEGSFWGKE